MPQIISGVQQIICGSARCIGHSSCSVSRVLSVLNCKDCRIQFRGVCFGKGCADALTLTINLALTLTHRCCRMYTAMRALVFGENFTSDPVSTILGYGLRYFSHGTLAINVELVSQVQSRVTIVKRQAQTKFRVPSSCTLIHQVGTKSCAASIPAQPQRRDGRVPSIWHGTRV